MFFRREKPQVSSFSQLTDQLRQQGFAVQPEAGGGARISKFGCAAIAKESGGVPVIETVGVEIGKEVGVLVDAGYQKYWLTPGKVQVAATVEHLRALHKFKEDLREGLGMVSLYNESLGTVNELHLYDRVKDRDHGVPKRPWER